MPGNMLSPSLAESWTVSDDQRVYEFKLREGLKFHNGDPFTAEDVKFSFYRAKSSRLLKEKVRDVEIADRYRVRFHLHEPFPDFMAFYGTLATASSWIVPKSYVEKVGDDGFRKAPVGLGPYRFVSNTPGVEVVLEAYESYWRKMPSVKRLVLKSVPEATTRAAMLRKGEVDIAYLLDAPAALELQRDPNFKVAFSGAIGIHFLEFFDQWDPKSPWHDRRVRLAASHAIDRKTINEAENLGASKLNGNIVPRTFEFALPLEPHAYDPARARQLLAEAGYPNGFKVTLKNRNIKLPYQDLAVYVVQEWRKIGVEAEHRPLETTSWYAEGRDKGNFELMVFPAGAFVDDPDQLLAPYITGSPQNWARFSNPAMDDLYARQARSLDPAERRKLVVEMQKIALENVYTMPVLWWSRNVVHWAKVKNWIAPPSHFTNQRLQDVWLSED
jgi:peptide/nickel transport system substrate-binding protein